MNKRIAALTALTFTFFSQLCTGGYFFFFGKGAGFRLLFDSKK